jgi:hypothetical protein
VADAGIGAEVDLLADRAEVLIELGDERRGDRLVGLALGDQRRAGRELGAGIVA